MIHRGSVLVIEDDQDVSDAMSETLGDAGYAVATARNGAIALSALRAARELPALILLDLMMPVMDGAHFLMVMRNDARLATLPVVLVTADGHATTKAARLGVQGGIKKPVQLNELLFTVAKYCQPWRGD